MREEVPAKKFYVTMRRFGLDDGGDIRTVASVSRWVGLSATRTRQIIEEAIAKTVLAYEAKEKIAKLKRLDANRERNHEVGNTTAGDCGGV